MANFCSGGRDSIHATTRWWVSASANLVEQFGGVEQMDPVEAYVQQMVASGYDEQTARQYAEQYYASYYAQQKGGN